MFLVVLLLKIGSGLTKATLQAKKAGKYLSRNEKLKRYGKGALAGGAAEAAFVGDVEDAGTFGDFLGGPTEIDRESKTPEAELLNRLKFGCRRWVVYIRYRSRCKRYI